MAKFEKKMLALSEIKSNQNNPRIISESKLKKLINSLLVFPKMMQLRPITLDENLFNLGGNMRQTALARIAQMKYGELKEHIGNLPEFADLPDGGEEVLAYWKKFLRKPTAYVQIAYDLTEEEKQAFIIKDNVSFGDWDYDELETWDKEKLDAWGLDTTMPDFGQQYGSEIGQQKDPTNSELDVDGFGDKIKMVLELSIEEHAFIQQRLSQDGMTKEQVLLNLLGYAEQ